MALSTARHVEASARHVEASARHVEASARHVEAHVTPMLTDKYQISMAYPYWRNGRHEEPAVFDLFFRTAPFKGEFTIFSGLDSCLEFLRNFKFYSSDIDYLKTQMPDCVEGFWTWLGQLDTSGLTVSAMSEGTVCFGRETLIRLEGPLGLCQLLETTLLNLCNFSSLVTTNAARMVRAAGPGKVCAEFGLRRAQGPDGGLTASKGAFLGGFKSTSNMLAGKMFGIPTVGTMAHSFICSFKSSAVGSPNITTADGSVIDFVALTMQIREELGSMELGGKRLDFMKSNESELLAFISYAITYPKGFLALIDTYNTLESGVLNFICVGLALLKCGYKPLGIRLDSGDLAYLSKEVRKMTLPHFGRINIVASNDINEAVLASLTAQGHEIDTFGIGTNLVTCQAQPALGMVYKLVQINGEPCIKLSEDTVKITMPGSKDIYRVFGASGAPLMDVISIAGETAPEAGVRMLVRNPAKPTDRAYVTPSRVEPLLKVVFRGGRSIVEGSTEPPTFWCAPSVPLTESRAYVQAQLDTFPEEHLRALNPTPCKVMVTASLFHRIETLMQEACPPAEIA